MKRSAQTVSRRIASCLLVVVVSMAIGVNTFTFAVLTTWIVDPLALPRSESLVELTCAMTNNSKVRSCPKQLLHYFRQQTQHFEDVGYYTSPTAVHVTIPRDQRSLTATLVSPSFFTILARQTLVGRWFDDGDVAPYPRRMVISYDAWTTKFGARKDISGSAVALNKEQAIIVGVMPRNFGLPAASVEAWILDSPWAEVQGEREWNSVGVARLAPGASLTQAKTELFELARQFANESGSARLDIVVVPLVSVFIGEVKPLFWAIFLVSNVVICSAACTASAFVGQYRQDFRARNQSQVTISKNERYCEYLIATCVTTIIGLGITRALFVAFMALGLSASLPPSANVESIPFGPREWQYCALVSGGCWILAWFLRARATRACSLERGGNTTSEARFPRHLAASSFQWAIVASLVVSTAGEFHRLWRLEHPDVGFDPNCLLALQLAPQTDNSMSSPRLQSVMASMRHVSGIQDVAIATTTPLLGSSSTAMVYIHDNKRPSRVSTNVESVSEGYFRTMRMHLLSGREFGTQDDASSPCVAIASRAFVRMNLQGANPLGRVVALVDAATTRDICTVIGVAPDLREVAPEAVVNPSPVLYLSYLQHESSMRTILVRAPTSARLSSILSSIVSAQMSDRDLAFVAPVSTFFQRALVIPRTTTFHLLLFLLCAIGAALLPNLTDITPAIAFDGPRPICRQSSTPYCENRCPVTIVSLVTPGGVILGCLGLMGSLCITRPMTPGHSLVLDTSSALALSLLCLVGVRQLYRYRCRRNVATTSGSVQSLSKCLDSAVSTHTSKQ